MVLDTRQLKAINTDLVRKVIREHESITRGDLVGITGLSPSTCRNVLKELQLSGEIKEMGQAPSTGGRPSKRYIYNENFSLAALVYACLEKKKAHLFVSVINLRGVELYEEKRVFDDIDSDTLDAMIGELIEQYSSISIIALGIPGITDGGVIGLCDFSLLSGFRAKEFFEEKYNCSVVLGNDVNLIAEGYYHASGEECRESLIYLYYPEETLPGAGIVVNGQVIKGRSQFAGEVSFIPSKVDRDEQGLIQKHKKQFAYLVVDTLLTLDCIVNPDKIVISGQWFSRKLKSLIEEKLGEKAPKGHVPELFFENDIHQSYREGLKFAALAETDCGLRIVEAKR